ncbi:hypothetical protein Ade02nite_12340 [Paractinoplanes deccanensis]|uniref:Uncharacterized protein n=1 Tax=Paractinoplanes deccanensis TaxID=113561 RepID=A0ABQ3XXY3_9ACTN|nr:hypothetical protein Ade02nite_12340 [Actinoplanes deccanensis]
MAKNSANTQRHSVASVIVDSPDDDSPWPFEATEADTPSAVWHWMLGILIVVILLCGGAVLALNTWLAHQADKVSTSSRPGIHPRTSPPGR